MPELPEVDSYRTGLAKPLIGLELNGGNALWHSASKSNFSLIRGQKIVGLDRRGKYLIINLNSYHLIIHLRMTGRIDIVKGEIPKYTTVQINFTNGQKL